MAGTDIVKCPDTVIDISDSYVSSGYLSGVWSNGEEAEEVEPGKEAVEEEEVVLTPEEEKDFWNEIGYNDGTKKKMSDVLARIQHEDRLSMSR